MDVLRLERTMNKIGVCVNPLRVVVARRDTNNSSSKPPEIQALPIFAAGRRTVSGAALPKRRQLAAVHRVAEPV
jgi:hypothetical protein